MMAHNLGRELQMRSSAPERATQPKRPAAWIFQTLDAMRHRFIQRAGRPPGPKGGTVTVHLGLTHSSFPRARATFCRADSLMSSAWFSRREIAVF